MPGVEELRINALSSAPGMPLKTAMVAHADAKKSTGHSRHARPPVDSRHQRSRRSLSTSIAPIQSSKMQIIALRPAPFGPRTSLRVSAPSKLPLFWNASCDYLAGL